MTDRPWQRGDKMIALKGMDKERICWLTRKTENGDWRVSRTPDLKEECESHRPANLVPADFESDHVNDLNNLDHIDLATQHMGYSLGRAVECLWAADQGDPATSLRELRTAQHHIQVEITRREWKDSNR